ncbi:MAG: hypothetical protein FWF44_04330 [Defluviitaleaceae bacterium]|nr:hypothetical protein [Defluviitaleaceae bacterium]
MVWHSILPAFFASVVEFVEALTIVLAVGVTINWKSSLTGAAVASVVLAVLVAVFGTALVKYIPLEILRLVIGTILILFGLQWLRKSVLRYGGLKSLHDEEAIYQREVAALKERGEANADTRFNKFGFLTAFKSVLLEGMEVIFIVITFGSTAADDKMSGFLSAAFGALCAFVLVAGVGAAIHKPLARIPENTLKFFVGIMLAAFGTFWAGEGFGVNWPLSDVFIIILAAIYIVVCFALVQWIKRAGRVAK